MIGITLFEGLFTYIGTLLSFRLQVIFTHEFRERVFRQLLDVEIRYIYREKTGDLFTVLYHYTERIGLLVSSLGNTLNPIFTILIYAVMLIPVSWEMTLLAVVWLGLMSNLIKGQLGSRIRARTIRVNQATKRVHGISLESLSAMKLIRMTAKEEDAFQLYQSVITDYDQSIFGSG